MFLFSLRICQAAKTAWDRAYKRRHVSISVHICPFPRVQLSKGSQVYTIHHKPLVGEKRERKHFGARELRFLKISGVARLFAKGMRDRCERAREISAGEIRPFDRHSKRTNAEREMRPRLSRVAHIPVCSPRSRAMHHPEQGSYFKYGKRSSHTRHDCISSFPGPRYHSLRMRH